MKNLKINAKTAIIISITIVAIGMYGCGSKQESKKLPNLIDYKTVSKNAQRRRKSITIY